MERGEWRRGLWFCFSISLLTCLLSGCPPSEVPVTVDEVVGIVTDTSAKVFLQTGPYAADGAYFKMGYDTSPHEADRDYPLETPPELAVRSGGRLVLSIPGGLTPDTQYYYRIARKNSLQSDWIWREEGRFHTRRAAGSPFRFCVLSDLHLGRPPFPEPKTKIAQNVASDNPDFVVSLGDMLTFCNQGHGIPVECNFAYLQYILGGQQATFAAYEDAISQVLNEFTHSSMLLWVNGNHEGLAGYLTPCLERAWILNSRNRYLPLLNHADPFGFYGDLVWGDVHIIWLDPLAFSTYDPYQANQPQGYALGTAQAAWLEDTLAESTSRWKLIFSHTLFGGAGPDFPCAPAGSYARGNVNFVDTPGTDQNYIQYLMESYGVNAFFYGHDHMYSVSEYPGSSVKYVLVGSGSVSGWTSCLVPYYQPWAVINDQIGHLRVDVNEDSLVVHYVKAALDGTNGTILATHEIVPPPPP